MVNALYSFPPLECTLCTGQVERMTSYHNVYDFSLLWSCEVSCVRNIFAVYLWSRSRYATLHVAHIHARFLSFECAWTCLISEWERANLVVGMDQFFLYGGGHHNVILSTNAKFYLKNSVFEGSSLMGAAQHHFRETVEEREVRLIQHGLHCATATEGVCER